MLLIRPLPVDAPDRLAVIVAASRDNPGMWAPHSYSSYVTIRDHDSAFTGLAACKETAVALTGDDQSGERGAQHAEVLRGQIVSGNFFEVLGIRPSLGRTFSPDEDHVPGARPVVVLSHALWRRRFRADASLPGRTIYLNGEGQFSVIGVAPPAFKGTMFALEMDFWAPLMMQAQLGGSVDWFKGNDIDLTLIGRLKPAVTRAQAEALLNTLAQAGENEPVRFRVVSEVEARHLGLFKWMALIATLALAVSGLVLLVACGNVANLLLARGTARSREIVTRLALGAGGWRIIRQLLTESLLLALLGGGLGLLLAYWGTDLMSAAVPKNTDQPLVTRFRSRRACLRVGIFGRGPLGGALRPGSGVAVSAHRRGPWAEERDRRQRRRRAPIQPAQRPHHQPARAVDGRARVRRALRQDLTCGREGRPGVRDTAVGFPAPRSRHAGLQRGGCQDVLRKAGTGR